MNLRDWKTRFAPRILRRGESYCYDGAVRALRWDGKRITATVSGTDDYRVKIAVTNDIVGAMSCSCPYAEEDNCKHMAAVLFAASGDAFPGDGQDGRPGESSGVTLAEAAQALSASDARALLLDCAQRYPEIAERLLLKATGAIPPEQVQAWRKQIINLSVNYCDRSGFIDYGDAEEYTSELSGILTEKVPLLLDAGMPSDAFSLTARAFQEASELDMDDSEGGLEAFYAVCAELWRDIIPRMNQAERHKMFDWFQEHYRRWAMASDIFDAFLFGDSERPAAFPEAEFLRRKLEMLDESIPKARETRYPYDLQHLVVRRLEIMEKLSMSREDIDAFAGKYYELWDVRKYLVEEAVREERLDDAIDILRESKEIDKDSPRWLKDDSDKLIELLQTLDRPQELREELLFQMENVYQRDLRYVNLLKGLTASEAWPELRERLLSLVKLEGVHGALMEQEGLYERLLRHALNRKNMDYMDRFFKTLKGRYPDALREFYAERLRKGMEGASDRKQYAECARRLKKVREIPGGDDTAAQLADEWRKTYPRRRAMLDELKKNGF